MQPAALGGASGTGGKDRPRFRQDLVAELIEAPGARFIDVMAPDSGNVFRFYEVEYSLACGMDGERDVAGIVKWAQDELGLTPSHQEVRNVISTLGDLGFIDAGVGAGVGAGAEAAVAATAAEVPPGVAPSSVAPPPVRPVPSFEPSGTGSGAVRAPQPPPPEVSAVAPGPAGAAPRITRPTPAPAVDMEMEVDEGLPAPGERITRPTSTPPEPDLSDESDVSIDLADHIAVHPDDVKEAVRASKVMSAVEVPPDIADALEAIEDRPTGPSLELGYEATERGRPPEGMRGPEPSRAPDTLRTPDTLRPPGPSQERTAERSSESRSEIRVGKSPPTRQPSASRPPVELPSPPLPVPVPEAPLSSSEPSKGISPVLIVLLVLVVLAAGGFLAWKYLLAQPLPGADIIPVTPPPVVKPLPPPPPPPPSPAAKIALETPQPDEVKLTRNGVIENILADKTAVKEGDVIMRLVGDKPIEAELAGLARDQKRLKDLIEAATKRRDTAQAAGNKAATTAAENEIAARQQTLTAKQDQATKRTADLDNFLIRAPASGTFSPAAKPGQKVTADAVVARIQRDPLPVATFKVGNTRPFAANASVEVAIGKGEQRVTCTVADVQPDSVKVTCPADPALTDGTDVALNVPAAMAPETPAPAPSEAPAPAPAGSSADSPSGTGSAAGAPSEAPAPAGSGSGPG